MSELDTRKEGNSLPDSVTPCHKKQRGGGGGQKKEINRDREIECERLGCKRWRVKPSRPVQFTLREIRNKII